MTAHRRPLPPALAALPDGDGNHFPGVDVDAAARRFAESLVPCTSCEHVRAHHGARRPHRCTACPCQRFTDREA